MGKTRGLSVMLRLIIVCSLTGSFLVLATGCGGSAGAARLTRFIGAGKSVAVINNGYLVSLSRASVEFKQHDSNSIIGTAKGSFVQAYGGNVSYAFTITIAYKPSDDNYLLEIESDNQNFFPDLKDMYLTYSEDTGYSGEGNILVNGNNLLYKAIINSEKLAVSLKDADNKEVSTFSLDFPKPDDDS